MYLLGQRIYFSVSRISGGLICGLCPSMHLRLVFKLMLCWKAPRWVRLRCYRFGEPAEGGSYRDLFNWRFPRARLP